MSCVQDSKRFFTCHSGNYLWSCSVLIRAGRPEGFFPCLHCGWRMTRGRVPGLRSSRCHYRCYCRCRSSATPPRNLSGQPDIISLKAGKLKPILKFINDTQQKGPGPWRIQITYSAGKELINTPRARRRASSWL